MSFRLTIALVSCLSMSACATVDLDAMAAANNTSKAKFVDANVVQRAAAKLYAAFTNKGFVAKTSQKRVQSAAHILLKGLEDQEIKTSEIGYASTAVDPLTVLTDIRTASHHVEQTTKAAEVYLAIAPAGKSVREELDSLEEVLLASRAVETVFEEALMNTGGSLTSLEFTSYNMHVGELKNVTNAFGDRVRESTSTRLAALN